ncbi:bile acid:Na+ symporter, BASS family [Pustulibacterium marinum]|uniref:Bile acid:Na+ symporter, BASS family n=1 Tax=Pustulibacterium marinum TaxID=1224947 RepID=A0A1I7HBR9_9FLAO|nr:hypothetical protein [Pustulibacterium marinum]SFU58160.1 bile acid:Na+ symporter, BASS family [Pustulibacterium marinum]
MKKSLYIILAITLGMLLPQLHVFTFLIRYSLMLMLFLTFTGIQISYKNVGRIHIQVSILILIASLFHYWWIKQLFPDLAMVGFILGATPTAAAAAVVANMMKLNVPFVTVSTVLTNIVAVIFIPILLPFLIQKQLEVSPFYIVLQVFITLGIPLLLGQFITLKFPKITEKVVKQKPLSFALFIGNMLVASANSSNYIQHNAKASLETIAIIAGLTCIVGFLNFKMGEWTAPKALRYESGLSTGRKNTMLALWLCLTYINPLIGLAPVFYLVFHNIYNSVQLWFLEKKRKNFT